jgi:hypothetical protein
MTVAAWAVVVVHTAPMPMVLLAQVAMAVTMQAKSNGANNTRAHSQANCVLISAKMLTG